MTPKRGSSGRPGVGKDGAAGVTVQAILPREAVEALDTWAAANNMGRGPAVRRMIEDFFGSAVCRFIDALGAADADTRQHMMDVLRANRCMYCGGPYGCQCWNDE